MRHPGEFDAMAAETLERPYDFHAALRELAPVHFEPRLECFLISRYDDVKAVILDTATFSSAIGPAAVLPPPEAIAILLSGHPPVSTLLTADPPAHDRYRALVHKAFTPSRVRRLEGAIRSVASDLVDGFAADGRVELVSRFASPFPLTIIADQLGVPRADMPDFKRWSDHNIHFLSGTATPEEYVECTRGMIEFQRYFERRIQERRARREDDVLSDLVDARLDGVAPLDVPEMLSILQQILVAGNETTTHAVASAVLLLLENPDQLARVRADRSLVPAAFEEALRMESPTQTLFRVATRDAGLHGVRIPKGARVAVMYGAANRDPRRFPDPDRFDVGRPNLREHLAFGFGTHFCLGAGLARKEGAVALDVLLERLPGLRLAPGNDFAHQPSFILRGLRRLELEFEPG
jgi:cytochrome P450